MLPTAQVHAFLEIQTAMNSNFRDANMQKIHVPKVTKEAFYGKRCMVLITSSYCLSLCPFLVSSLILTL